MKTNVVYLHVKKGTNDVFYVGIGTNKRRAYSLKSRSVFWHNVVNRYGYDVVIVNAGLSRDDACYIEKELIYTFGRRDLGTGQLVNQTDGGDGISSEDATRINTGRVNSNEMRHNAH